MPLQTEHTPFVTGNVCRIQVLSSDSQRVAKFRSKHGRLDVPDYLAVSQTIDALASEFGCSKSVVVGSLRRVALTNRDWKKQGLLWGD